MRAPRLALLILSFALLPAFAKQAWDFNDTSWTFPTAKIKFGGKAKGIGTVKAFVETGGDVTLHADGTWVLSYGSSEIAAGTWEVTDEFDKSIDLSLSPEGETELFDFIENQIEQNAAADGIVVDVSLDTPVKEKLKLTLKPSLKKQTAKVKLSVKLKMTGTTDGLGIVDAPTNVHASLKTISDEVPLANVLP
ncbi:MAG TPA: hypothetical protein VFY71_18250 [Planctomycetota bacterium]|nr:hypothetical protein [Planctomycetota bacterium]